ncbi:MAG: phosphotransacetylase family protein [Candidatus Bathyarchaeia archaeon]
MGKKAVYIASNDDDSGKSIVTLSLAIIAKEMGKNVGYFKPLGMETSFTPGMEAVDEDVEIFKKVLNLEFESKTLCPITLRRDFFLEDFTKFDPARYIEKINSAFRAVSEGKDVTLIEGPPSLATGSFIGCPVPRLAKEFNADIMLVAKFTDEFVVDEVLRAKDYCARWNTRIAGVLLNRISPDRVYDVKDKIKPFIERQGLNVLGLIPEEAKLSALTAGEVCDFLGGKVLAGLEGLENIVETILIGAMTPESAAKHFQKAKNELVVTGGDRNDIILTALETGASAIILTGNLYPSVKVLPRADELKIPLILVPYDTYTTLQHINKVIGRVKPKDIRRIEIAAELIKKNVDWKQILE